MSFRCISKYRGVLMGLSILSILIFHYTEDCVNAGYNLIGPVVDFKNYVGSCGVDIFLFLSGLGLYYSFKKNSDIKQFYQKRLTRILIPYFMVAIPAWLIYDLLYLNVGIVQMFKDIFFISFFTDKVIWFWYILLMAICYIAYPFMFDFIDKEDNDKTKMLQVFAAITLVALLLATYNPTFFNKIEIALTRFPAFFAGSLIGKASYNDKKISYGTITILFLSLLLINLRLTSKSILFRYIVAIYAIAFIILVAIALDLLAKKGIKCTILKKIIEWFGNYSLELYLTHVAIRRIMNRYNYPTYRIRYYVIMIVLSVLLSLIIKKLTTIITAPKKNKAN